jgi:hypothetical protein
LSSSDIDVLIATDCRLPGGTAASIAEEIGAQARAGLRTGLLHLPSHLVAGERPFNDRLLRCLQRGEAELVVDRERVRARAFVVRQPKILTEPLRVDPPRVDTEVRLMVANHTPRDRSGRRRFYDPAAVQDALRTTFGGDWRWAPIGPAVRQGLDASGARLPLLDDDWVNVIDVDRWTSERRTPLGSPVVLGRHGRDTWDKWPRNAADLLAVYPERPDVEVRILGGAETAERLIGRRPRNWMVHPYGAMTAQAFLAEIDFFVYYPHPDSLEAFGRTILEALASGAVVVLPERFESLFGDAALYAPPSAVTRTVLDLAADTSTYEAASTHGQERARECFSYATHHRRLSTLIGPTDIVPVAAARTAKSQPPRRRRTPILFVSSNGAGVGHLMRLMAMARRADDDMEPLLLTLSQAISVVDELGFAVEYLMSSGYSGMRHADWHAYLRARLDELVRQHRPAALVFDGTYPWDPIVELADDHPDVKLIWSRRGMWRADAELGQLPQAPRFDLIIEPGEIAAAADTGPTRRRDDALRVGPVLLIDEHEQLVAEEARLELGLDPDRPAALVQLGAGNINDVGSTLGIVVDRLGRVDDLQVCLAESAITVEPAEGLEVHRFSVYPLARYLRAFDLAVSAAGYNSYHELITTGVPTIFIPNLNTATDDQAARARFAEEQGAAVALYDPDAGAIERAVDLVLDPDRCAKMSQRCRELSRGNGAAEAMRAIITTARGHEPARSQERAHVSSTQRECATPTVGATARRVVASFMRRLRSLYASVPETMKRALRPLVRAAPTSLTRRGERTAWHGDRPVVLFVLLDLGNEVEDAVDVVARLHTSTAAFEPLFVTSVRDLAPFRRHGFAIEFVAPPERWSGDEADWASYVRTRLRSVVTAHRPVHTVTVDRAGGPLREAWFAELLISLRTS